ncbi:MAG: ABC transporter substrate-binding protein [Bacteroidales bacterium]|nr:ABC transporter substrate-binding protein [Bacteroidales bacterium]
MRKIALLILAALFAVSCTSGVNTENLTDTITDDYGRQVVVPTAPQHIVSTSPAVTEIIFALGGGPLLCGRTDFCAYPPQVAQIPSIGGISNLNVEHVLSLSPDLVVSGSMVPEKCVAQLQAMNVPVVCVPEKTTFQGLYQNIATIGALIGRAEAADSLNQQIRQQLQHIAQRTDTAHRPTLYYVVGFGAGGNYTAGGGTFINDIITLAGASNIAQDVEGWNYSLEALMQHDPDYILIRSADSAAFCSMAPYTKLSAVRQGRVIAIESGMIDLQVPRNLDAIKLISARISGK